MVSFINQSPTDMWEYVSGRNPTGLCMYSFAASSFSFISEPSTEAISSLFREATKDLGQFHKSRGHSEYDVSVEVYSGDALLAKSKWTIFISAFTPVKKSRR